LIHGSPELAVIAGRLDMFILSGYGSDMSVSGCNLIFRPGTGVYSSIAAVVADPIDRGSIYDRGVVNVMNVYHVHIVHRTVVEEASAVPPPAFVALAEITIAVGDAAVETDMRTPVAFMEKKAVAAPTPITRRPQETDLGWLHPSARDPIVISVIVVVGPVARSPNVTLGGARRLLVDRQSRRANSDRYADLRERDCRKDND
jgi:hypothetical protein